MLIDTTQVRPDEANAAVEYLCKSVEDALIFAPHPSEPLLTEVENRSTEAVARALTDLYGQMSRALTGRGPAERALLLKADPLPWGTGLRRRCEELEEAVRHAVPGTLSLDDYLAMVDCLMARYLPATTLVTDVQRHAVRQYMAGYLKGRPGATAAILPATIEEAVRQWKILPADRARIRIAQENAVRLVTDLDAATRSRMKKVILDAERRRVSDKTDRYARGPLEQALAEEFGDLNRDWRRIAVTETAFNASDGYLASRGIGETVQWLAHPGACVACLSYHGKVFTVVSATKPEKDPFTEVWPGKAVMNVGRSLAKMKRTDTGEVVPRTADELAVPVIPLHPHCRCNWIPAVDRSRLTEQQRRILAGVGIA